MGKVMRHTLGASLNIRHNLSSSKGPKPLQLKLLTTYIPKTSAFTLAFRSEERFSRNAETDLVCRLLLEKKKINEIEQHLVKYIVDLNPSLTYASSYIPHNTTSTTPHEFLPYTRL